MQKRKKIEDNEIEEGIPIETPETSQVKPQKKKRSKRGEYIGNIIVNLIILYVFNSLPYWHLNFLTSDYTKVLPFANWSIEVTILVNIFYLFYSDYWFRKLSQCITNVLSIIFLRAFYIYFPIIFPAPFTSLIRFCLSLSIFIIMIITVVTFIQFLVSFGKENKT